MSGTDGGTADVAGLAATLARARRAAADAFAGMAAFAPVALRRGATLPEPAWPGAHTQSGREFARHWLAQRRTVPQEPVPRRQAAREAAPAAASVVRGAGADVAGQALRGVPAGRESAGMAELVPVAPSVAPPAAASGALLRAEGEGATTASPPVPVAPATWTASAPAAAAAPDWRGSPSSTALLPAPPLSFAAFAPPGAQLSATPVMTARTSPGVAAMETSAQPFDRAQPAMALPQAWAQSLMHTADPSAAAFASPAAPSSGAGGSDEAWQAAAPAGSRAPQAASAGSSGPAGGDVFLDGQRMGRWVAEQLSREAGRPQRGAAAFDPRLGARWPGTLQGG